MKSFSARIRKIGVNPYLEVPEDVLRELFEQANRNKGPVAVRGKLDGKAFKQTVVKYQGLWRLYLNTQMRRDAGVDVGDDASVQLEFDPEPRLVPMHPKFARALSENREARVAFQQRAPSHRREILRYLNSMKTEESLARNIEKVIQHLLGKRPKGLDALMRRKA